MNNDDNQIRQFERIWRTYKSMKYSKIHYCDSDKIIFFSDLTPIRNKTLYCDEPIWDIFEKEMLSEEDN